MTDALPSCVCGEPGRVDTKSRRDIFRRTGRSYCSDACRDRWTAEQSSARMAQTNRRHASARMTERNPMAKPESRERMAATLRAVGHAPKQRGGNGRGTTEAQQRLADALGWPTEVIVKTGKPRRPGVPTHYKLDIADVVTKRAVEVDGRSHGSLERRSQDERKDEFLAAQGWRVVRVTNEQVLVDLAGAAGRALAL